MAKKLVSILILIAFFIVVVYFYIGGNVSTTSTSLNEVSDLPKNESMKISSTAFSDHQLIPARYTCDGADVNPPLSFTGLPQETKSLALIVDDPDAPMGTWVHWVVFNISPETNSIEEDSIPEDAVLGINDFGDTTYGGPCPPSGTHRYYFKLYALGAAVDLPEGSSKEELLSVIEDHVLGCTELIGLYER